MFDNVQKKVLEIVDENHAKTIALLQELVAVPSVIGGEGPVQEIVDKKLRELDFDKIDMWEPDLEELKKDPWFFGYPGLDEIGYHNRPVIVGTLKGSGGGRSLMLYGHVDVVPAGEGWTYDPWVGQIVGNKMYGRGTSDMKAGVASMLIALESLKKAGIKLKGDVLYESVIDEEVGGNGCLACALKGYSADAAILAESTDLTIMTASQGFICVKINVKGKSAHAPHKHLGICGIKKGYKIYQAIEDFQLAREEDVSHPAYNHKEHPYIVPLVVGTFNAGDSIFTVPGNVSMECRIGLLPNERPEDVFEAFCSQIKKAAELDPWLRHNLPEVELLGSPIYPAEIERSHPFVETIKKSFTAVTGTDPVLTARTAGTEQRTVVLRQNTPALLFGGGVAATGHTADEYTELDTLLQTTKIYALTLLDWCGY